MENENDSETEAAGEPIVEEKSPSNLPFVLTLAALLIYFLFQTLLLIGERSNLSQAKSSQEGAIQEAEKVQGQFRTLVTKTGELAEKGHAGARMVMEGLQRQGMGMAAGEPAKTPLKPEAKAVK